MYRKKYLHHIKFNDIIFYIINKRRRILVNKLLKPKLQITKKEIDIKGGIKKWKNQKFILQIKYQKKV